ncbi:MAG: ATP-binding protein [Polyangiaceae bacterium]
MGSPCQDCEARRWYPPGLVPTRRCSSDACSQRWVGAPGPSDHVAPIDALVERLTFVNRRREEAESALRNIERLATIGQLAAGIVHDLNNALQPAVGALDILEEEVEDPFAKDTVRIGQRSLVRVTEMVRGILGFLQKASPKKSQVHLPDLLANLEVLLRHAARSSTQVSFDVDPATWPVLVEPHRLESALLNITINARDAMKGAGRLDISVRNLPAAEDKPAVMRPGEYILISLSDTGPGMSPEVLARATEPFFTTKGAKGTGLGLAMVRSFASESGGHMRITSVFNKGTRVDIFLPRAPRARENGEMSVQDRLMARLRDPVLREAYRAWLEIRGSQTFVSAAELGPVLKPYATDMFVATVSGGETGPLSFRVVALGEGLSASLDRAFEPGASREEALGGAQETAYRRAVQGRFPTYEYARFNLGDGPSTLFERLLLPVSEDGNRVTHLLGLVRIVDLEIP